MGRVHCLLGPLVLSLGLGLGYTLFTMPPQTAEIQNMVADNLEASGVSNPVTAVLLNFRGYDTFLELVVLLVALLGVWSLEVTPWTPEPRPGPVLETLARLLVPVMILVAGYLLWVGGQAPGGAFQAGSVLAAAGVLLLLSGWRLDPRLSGFALRLLLVTGIATFLLVALATLLGGQLLQYPLAQAKTLILIIESMATVSIGVTLIALFIGSRPSSGKDRG